MNFILIFHLGIEWAEKALEREEEYPQDLKARCHLYIGIGHYLKATEVRYFFKVLELL